MILHPVSDAIAWLRLLAGVLVILGLPGFWLLGRFVKTDWPVRVLVSLMAGILAISGSAMFTARLGLPFTMPIWLIGAGVLGLGAGFWPGYRRVLSDLAGKGERYGRGQWLVLAAICLALAATVVQIQGQFPVPPGFHDSGNHAFLTLRIMETGHTDAEHIFSFPYGKPQRPYFTGWHASAALVCRAGGLPAYVGTWLFSLLTLILLPLALALVYREIGFRPWTAVLAASLLLVCGNILVEIPLRGGMGQYVGMFCLPLPMMALVWAFRRAEFGLAVLGGVALAFLIWVHGSWALIALLLAVVALWSRPSTEGAVGRRSYLVAFVAVACCAAIAVWDVLPTAAVYRQNAYRPQEMISLGKSLSLLFGSVGGGVILGLLAVVGLLVGLGRRPTRPTAIMAALLGVLAVTLASVQDPVSLWIGQPWYQIYFRLHRPQIFLLAPLVAVLFELLWRWWPLRLGSRYRLPLVGLLAVACIIPARANLDPGKLEATTLFTDDDVRLAHRIPAIVPEGAYVANYRNDGSCWAMQISNRKFLQGSNWVLGATDGLNYHGHVIELVSRTMTRRVAKLRAMGCNFVWATDHWPFKVAPILSRAQLNRDPRFTPLLVGRYSTLYRIEWGMFPRTPSP